MKQINWPALLKLDGADDLLYLDSVQEWNLLSELRLGDEDRLCDSEGKLYKLQCLGQRILPVSLPQRIDLQQLNEWVRGHLVAMQQCCVYKVALQSITEGMRLVKETQEQ